MKARILILCLFACAALIFVWPAALAATPQPRDASTALTESVVTRIFPVPTTAVILITELGLQPREVTIQPGGVVT